MIICYLIFPDLLTHIFSGYRGTQAISNLTQSDFLSRFIKFFDVFAKQLSLNIFGLFLLVLLILKTLKRLISIKLIAPLVPHEYYRLILGYRNNRVKPTREFSIRFDNCFFYWFIVFTAFVLPFCTLVKIAPYIVPRYMAPQFPLCVLLLVGVFSYLLRRIRNEKMVLAFSFCLLVMMCVNSFDRNKITWYGTGYSSFNQLIADSPSTTCIGITDKKVWWRILTQGYRFSKCNQTYFFTDKEIDFGLIPKHESESVVVWIDTHLNKKEKSILEELQTRLSLRSKKRLFYDYGDVYLLN